MSGAPLSGFMPASWRGVTGSVSRGAFGVSFDTVDGPVRVLLSVDCARNLADVLAGYLADSGPGTTSAGRDEVDDA